MPARSRRITLPELLTAIGIIALLLALTFPVIAVLRSSTRVEAGMITVGMAADVARQWVEPEAWANDGGTTAPINERYSGTAALYCPTGEIRILSNTRSARALQGTIEYLEDRSPEVNGYSDIAGVDYISIQDDIGVAGIYRDSTGAAKFIAPPFAIAFAANGQMSFGDAGGRIYYDGTNGGDGRYNIASSRRPTNYDPGDWDGETGSNNENPNTDSLVRDMPFEGIECVPGVVVYSREEFERAGHSFAGGGSLDVDSTAGQWLTENGQTMFFSQNSGIALRDE